MITAALIVVWLIVAWALAVRLGRFLRRRPVVGPFATFHAVPDGTRYLVCHNAGVCGRLQTRHERAGDGFWRCTTPGCGHTTKGEDH
ncbi:hypothetical protein ACF082_30000 [Streptomyces lydicus]|uniref:hypothetical protein n=1 Tax=Streptomyces lydicus TaxID=47763 RepID=UPI0036F82DC7